LKGQTPKYGGQFNDEQDAAKKVNQICKGFGIPLQNPGINGMPNQQHETKEKASQHKGVTYDKGTGKWRARCQLKGQTPTYGGVFEDELHAAIKVNEICKDFGIPEYNPTISAIPNHEYQKKEKTSQYKGVTWQKETGNWSVLMSRKGGKKEYGVFKNELDAAKMKREKKSQYKGVHWNAHCEKWGVRLYMKEKKRKYGGMFKDELDAAKRANQICEELGIPTLNPEINAIPNEQCQRNDKTSQYKGVSYKKQTCKWVARFHLKGHTPKYGGQFNNEEDAGKKVNQICKEFGIPPYNPEIDAIPNEGYENGKLIFV